MLLIVTTLYRSFFFTPITYGFKSDYYGNTFQKVAITKAIKIVTPFLQRENSAKIC